MHELGDVLNFVGAKAAVTASSIRGHDHGAMFAELKAKCPALAHVFISGETAWPAADTKRLDALPQADANEAATICWTSGTEARPKGVPRSHNHWMIAGVACADAAQLQPEMRCSILPLVNMAAIGGCFMPWLLTGGTLVQHHPFDLPVFLRQLVGEKIAYTVAPPAVLTMLLKEEKLMASLDFSHVRSIGSGSAPLSPWMVKTWQEQYGLPIVNIFGSNEGTCLISGAGDVPAPEERAQFFPRFGVKGLKWPAKIADAIETKLIDLQTGEEITEPGKPGELLIKGATLFAGYYRAGDGGGPADAIDKDAFPPATSLKSRPRQSLLPFERSTSSSAAVNISPGESRTARGSAQNQGSRRRRLCGPGRGERIRPCRSADGNADARRYPQPLRKPTCRPTSCLNARTQPPCRATRSAAQARAEVEIGSSKPRFLIPFLCGRSACSFQREVDGPCQGLTVFQTRGRRDRVEPERSRAGTLRIALSVRSETSRARNAW